jgi:hypothetical protein
MEGSGVATIAGRTLTIGGHQIEKISGATRHHGRAFDLVGAPIRSHWSRHQRTAQGGERLARQGSRASPGVTSDWSAPGW